MSQITIKTFLDPRPDALRQLLHQQRVQRCLGRIAGNVDWLAKLDSRFYRQRQEVQQHGETIRALERYQAIDGARQ